MDFKNNQPIYLQITHSIVDRILGGEWLSGERIPSVRELGCELEVNPNTVVRAYEWLSERGIIYNRRGIGFFISDDAIKIITAFRREELMCDKLREIAKEMSQLGISIDEVTQQIKRYTE